MVVKYSVESDIEIDICPDKSIAASDGNDSIVFSVSAVLTGSKEPVVGVPIVFSSDNHAVLSETNSIFYGTLTDGTGLARATLKNNYSEQVVVTAKLNDSSQNIVMAKVTFVDEVKPLVVEYAKNKNHTLLNNEPSIVWDNAEFIIQTSGGSGSLQWQVVNSTGDINVLSGSKGQGIVSILRENYGSHVIRADDIITGESIEYSFSVVNYIYSDNESYFLGELLVSPPGRIISPSVYQSLCREWGNMSAYSGWGGDYWSSDHNMKHNLAKVMNIDTGIDRYSRITLHQYKAAYQTK